MLPSQSARPSAPRAHMYRRTRGRLVPFIIVPIVAFSVVFGILKLWPGLKRNSLESASAANDSQTAETSSVVKPDAPLSNSTSKQAKVDPRPNSSLASTPAPATNTISMGSPAPSSGSTPDAPKKTESDTTSPPPAHPTESAGNSMLAAAPATTAHPVDTPAATTDANTGSGRLSPRMSAGLDLLARNKPLEARKTLTDALLYEKLSPADADRIRQTLTALNQKLVFGPDVIPGDTLTRTYTVESGDALAKLPRKLGLKTDYRLIARVNNMPSDNLRLGQRLKVVNGPFHAVVIKSDFRIDVFAGDWDQRVFVCSFPVGLGEYGATPEGVFAVRPNSKLIDPTWVNPRTGQKYEANDPQNPIGERWIGLIGVSDNIRDLSGYGIHGTIDPDSIGKQKSMGCVRMRADDVAIMYELLMENVSRIEIHGADYP